MEKRATVEDREIAEGLQLDAPRRAADIARDASYDDSETFRAGMPPARLSEAARWPPDAAADALSLELR